MHELFEAQVGKTPEAPALVVDDDSSDLRLTYVELNGLADRLAHRLRVLGVGPEDRVGVCLHRGVDIMVTLLAVLKAGGAYVPLDPDYPADRLAYMLADSAAAVVVTSHALASALGPYQGVLVHADDELDPAPELPAVRVRAQNPAYIMYTSGSTGRPKGVVVPHAGVVNRILWGVRRFAQGADERVLQKTPFSFDVSVPELFGPLAAGATVVMARPGGHRDPAYLARVLVRQRVTSVHFVPSMLRVFLAEPFGALPALRRMMCSGEALTADLVSAVADRFGCELYNLYGPTEASIEVTATRCHRDEPVTIGRAIDNTTAHVLDEDLMPVRDLEEGQLCLAGIQVTRGYHDRPGLTAERFVPDPHAAEPGGRLYLTGDLVRRLPDGAIDYLGRLDQQVKIRGNRVEPGEIESALAEDPAVAAAAVTVHSGRSAERRLVAYLVPSAQDGAGIDVADVRTRLSRRLPSYMIPALWLVIDDLPTTTSGKTDRNALPEVGSRRPDIGRAYRAPSTKTEQGLAEIWEGVLDVAPVGVRDDFIDLGGQSLAATRICARVRQTFGVHLSIDALLGAATVEQLAVLVDSDGTRSTSAGSRDPVGAPDTRRHPLSFAQQGVWLADRLSPDTADYNIFETYRLRGDIDQDALRGALADVIARHATLRTTFGEHGGVPYQSVAEDIPTPFESVVLTGDGADEATAVIDREIRRPFSLADGPLLRMTLLRLDTTDHVVLVVIHHIVADDWSMDVFFRDLSACYRTRTTAAPDELTPLAGQYVDHAVRQRELLRGAERARQLDHWRTQLAGARLVVDLPTDRPRAALRASADAVAFFTVPAPTTRAVAELARSAGATSFMTLMAAFAATVSVATGRDDFVVGTFSGNRTSVETEELVGLFVNSLALRMRCDGDPTFRELLGRVRSTALDAYRHQELPFDQVITALRPPRDLSRNPVIQVGFQSLGDRSDRFTLPGVSSAMVCAGQGGNSLDLLAIVRENGDRLAGELHYRTDLFSPAAAGALADGFTAVVTAVAGQPDRRLSTLPWSGSQRFLTWSGEQAPGAAR